MYFKYLEKIYDRLTHIIGKVTRKYYFEDFLRVYPDQVAINKLGIKRSYKEKDRRNFLNHSKFYFFVAQFVKDRQVADIGCGSGYGAKILKENGAAAVFGCDISSHSIKFAKEKFSQFGNFDVAEATDLLGCADSQFDVSISSEVLEHIKEYHREQVAIDQLKRITKLGGIIIIGTPNSEMLCDHGFSFNEIERLMKNNFKQYVIFENALIPFGKQKHLWSQRLQQKQIGAVISENINFDETVLPPDSTPQIKQGIDPGSYPLGQYDIDTTLLHNTHSWVVVAINNK